MTISYSRSLAVPDVLPCDNKWSVATVWISRAARGVSTIQVSADLIPERRSPVCRQKSAKYVGAWPFKHLWTSVASLNVIRWWTGNQFNERRTGVMCSESERREPVTNRTAAFCTDCSRWNWLSAMPYNKALQLSRRQLINAWTY